MQTHILSSTGSYWRSQFSFDFIAPEGLKTLRGICFNQHRFLEKHLDVELWMSNQQKDSESIIGQVSLPLIKICEGPFHIDYQLLSNKYIHSNVLH